MIAHWMLYCLAVGALLSLAALAMERAMRAFHLPQRWVWAAAMVLTLALPAAARWLPRAEPTVPAASYERVMQTPIPPGDVPAAAVESAPRIDLASLDRPLAIGWMALSAAALLALIAAWAVLERRRRGWRAAEVDGVPVLLSPATGPAVIGFFRSRIVLPRWVVEDAPADVRDLLLEHEQEHLRAGDPRLLALGLAAVALMPWNPAIWWQLRRLRLAVEVDCDARVLARRADVRAYGTLLLEVGRRGTGGRLMAAAFSEPQSFLERRIRIMTQRMHPPRARTLVPVLAICAAALLAMRALPAPAVPLHAQAASAVRGDTVLPVLVNGEAVTRALQQQYPPMLREAGVRGQAQVRFRVTEEGTPTDLRTIQASHPAFGEAAVQALAAARFRPARIGGSAVAYTVTLPVRFELSGEEWPAISTDAAPPRAGAWDQPPMPLNVEELTRALNAEYPPLLREAGITARAQVRVRIAPTGEVLGVETLSATHPEAGSAAERAMARARFRPARKDGQPVAAEIVLPVEFRVVEGARQP
jgi:TonB family protein